MPPPVVGNLAARRLFLRRHLLAERPASRLTRADLLATIEALGFVQVDSISTVARAHHMILAARSTAYRPHQLHALLERDRSLFEHWTHDAAVIPSAFYPYWSVRFARDRQRLADRWRRWHGETALAQTDAVLAHVRTHGAVRARDVGTGPAKPSGGWWDWHPNKTALEFLWRTGELAVARREGFQKVFDLTERVIPEPLRRQRPSLEAMIDWGCDGALNRLGFATSGELAAFWDMVSPAEAKAWCARQLRAGELIEVLLEGATGTAPRRTIARPELLDEALAAPPAARRLRLLSPFDPLLRDRNRCARLFGFDYRIEVFTPAARRTYGYYVFPLLEGEWLIGRIDMRRRADDGTLVVRAVWPEPSVRFGRDRRLRLEAELDRVARFVDAGGVEFASGWLRDPRPAA